MSKNGNWISVSREKPCIACGRPNQEHTSRRCSWLKDGRGCCCYWVESPYRAGEGWMFWVAESTNGRAVTQNAKSNVVKVVDFLWLAELYCKVATNARVVSLAKSLGVSFDSLRALNIGWDGKAWTFPMRDPSGKVVGIRRRFPDGKKLSVRGGHEGLFYDTAYPTGDIYVCEGPTDTAAMLTIGLQAIGRPSCSGGTKFLVEICAARRVVIVADGDAPGLRGARELKAQLSNATVIVPPDRSKDVRAWVNAGATKNDVLAMISP